MFSPTICSETASGQPVSTISTEISLLWEASINKRIKAWMEFLALWPGRCSTHESFILHNKGCLCSNVTVRSSTRHEKQKNFSCQSQPQQVADLLSLGYRWGEKNKGKQAAGCLWTTLGAEKVLRKQVCGIMHNKHPSTPVISPWVKNRTLYTALDQMTDTHNFNKTT